MTERFLVLLLAGAAWATPSRADVCVYKPPSVRHVAGTVFDSSGRPIPAVKVAVIQNNTSIATAMTNYAGSFSFDSLNEGAYELAATANGFQRAQYKFTLLHPTRHWNRSLQIELAVGMEHCGGKISLVQLK